MCLHPPLAELLKGGVRVSLDLGGKLSAERGHLQGWRTWDWSSSQASGLPAQPQPTLDRRLRDLKQSCDLGTRHSLINRGNHACPQIL
jgi:hypothetical protein